MAEHQFDESFRGEGHLLYDAHQKPAPTPEGTSSASDGGQRAYFTQRDAAPALAETIAAIRAAHRLRCFWMEQRKRSDLALGAYLRRELGWSLDKPASERKTIAAEAMAIMDAGEKYVKATRKTVKAAGKNSVPLVLPDMPDILKPFAHIVIPQIEMRGATDNIEGAAKKQMETLAEQLPVSQWANGIRGFGALGLAIIVGEAGDLGGYSNPSKLWKRMGVAVLDGKRQGGLPKSASAADWEAHGYNRVRRSRLYTIGSSMVMAGETPYRKLYLDRKAYEAARAEADGLTVAPSAKIPKGKQSEYRSLGHIDNRARRYVEKRLLRDLWRAWRAA
jgi:hypothetical protein